MFEEEKIEKFDEKNFLTIKEAVEEYRVLLGGETTARRIAKEHPEVTLVVGNRIFFRRKALENLFNESQQI